MVNSNILYIFNYETVFNLPDAKAILVDKREPSKALLKIPAEFATLFKQGFFRSHGFGIDYNGVQAWLSNDIMRQVQAKRPKIKPEHIGLSMREFHMDTAVEGKAKEFARLCGAIKYDIEAINHLTFITEQPLEAEHAEFAKHLKHYLSQALSKSDAKIKIDVVSVAGRNLTNKMGDDTVTKTMAVTEYLLGFKIRKNKVTPVELDTTYDLIHYLDNNDDYVQSVMNIGLIINGLTYTDQELKQEVLQEALTKRSVWAHYITSNIVNPLKSIQVKLK